MDRYGADFGRGPTRRYGREYDQWGAMTRYDGDYGFRGSRVGSFYDRDFSGYQSRDFGGRFGNRYDQGYSNRWASSPRYDQGYQGGYRAGYQGQGYAGRGRSFGQPQQQRAQGSYGPDWHEQVVMQERRYPSPWAESHPGMTYGFGLGFGQGRGQFIYK